MESAFRVYPIGVIRKQKGRTFIRIHEKYGDALLGLDQFSHILVFFWFHRNDAPDRRNTLRVHPRGDRNNPLTGVFGTRSPVRPNPVGIAACRVISIRENTIEIDTIDAFHGSPVIDIKPCLSQGDVNVNLKTPKWVKRDKTEKTGNPGQSPQ